MEPLLQVRSCAWQTGQCMTGGWSTTCTQAGTGGSSGLRWDGRGHLGCRWAKPLAPPPMLGNSWFKTLSNEEGAVCLLDDNTTCKYPHIPSHHYMQFPKLWLSTLESSAYIITLPAPLPRGHSWLILNLSTALRSFKLVNGDSVSLTGSRLRGLAHPGGTNPQNRFTQPQTPWRIVRGAPRTGGI